MIPYGHITEWRLRAPWISDHQVEQDLLISRALVEIYRDGTLVQLLAFQGRVNLVYRVLSEDRPPRPLRLKIEINSREHFALRGHVSAPFVVDSRWFAGDAAIRTYTIEELLATKLRALYQRKKGRDLFDLWYACRRVDVDTVLVAALCAEYFKRDGRAVSRAEFLANLAAKENDPTFGADVTPLLSTAVSWDVEQAFVFVKNELIERLR